MSVFCDHVPFGHPHVLGEAGPPGTRPGLLASDVLHGWHKLNEHSNKNNLKTPGITGKKQTTKQVLCLVFHLKFINTSLDVFSSGGCIRIVAKRKTAIRWLLQRNLARIIASNLWRHGASFCIISAANPRYSPQNMFWLVRLMGWNLLIYP